MNPNRRRFLVTAPVLASGLYSLDRAAAATPDAVVTPMQFGAKADGITDDSAAFNAMYAHARSTASRTVFLQGRRYAIARSIYARDVSTSGDGATLIVTLDNAKASYAFDWGGTNTFVAETNFDLSNRGPEAMQGVVNAVNDASNQRFFRNRVTARTTLPSRAGSNIYGLWLIGTGLDGVYVESNQFEQCSYGVQINNQDGMARNVQTHPLGKPSRNIHISGNSCIDATIGVNTPHVMCSNVVIEGNTILPQRMQIDLPLNVAHVTELVVRGNTVTSNAASANGTLHVEDASGAVTITANVITVSAANNGIQFGVDPSVSKDGKPLTRAVIVGNHVQGSVKSGNTVGILLPDPNTTDTTVSANYIAGFSQGIFTAAKSNVVGNTIVNCGTPLRLSKDSTAGQNVID